MLLCACCHGGEIREGEGVRLSRVADAATALRNCVAQRFTGDVRSDREGELSLRVRPIRCILQFCPVHMSDVVIGRTPTHCPDKKWTSTSWILAPGSSSSCRTLYAQRFGAQRLNATIIGVPVLGGSSLFYYTDCRPSARCVALLQRVDRCFDYFT
ncbi:hypothetical protein XENORESO_017929 [Xenotaenia resolanae]|uniref:Uncharacterized protein n=1 Tax=Xenotaenia resolanae TaxID=208358 RepID=A0ABV0WGJ3_9TELE